MKKLLYFYQRFFWYVTQAKNELLKPLGFWNETIMLLTFLAVWLDFRPAIKIIIISYIAILLVAAVMGKVIVWLGVLEYNTKLGNTQNPELSEILMRVRKIEDKLK